MTLHGESLIRLRRLQSAASGATSTPELRTTTAEVTAAGASFGDTWFARQHALGETLDFVEETVERLESLASEVEWCAERGIGRSRWEDLVAPPDCNGIAAIDPRAAS